MTTFETISGEEEWIGLTLAQADRSLNAQRNLIIVRLACCCGLRVSEIGALRLDDVNVDGARLHIRLRRETTKGRKSRCVPL